MRKLFVFSIITLTLASVVLLFPGRTSAQDNKTGKFPTLEVQLSSEYVGRTVKSGTELEKLILDNQEFSMLRKD